MLALRSSIIIATIVAFVAAQQGNSTDESPLSPAEQAQEAELGQKCASICEPFNEIIVRCYNDPNIMETVEAASACFCKTEQYQDLQSCSVCLLTYGGRDNKRAEDIGAIISLVSDVCKIVIDVGPIDEETKSSLSAIKGATATLALPVSTPVAGASTTVPAGGNNTAATLPTTTAGTNTTQGGGAAGDGGAATGLKLGLSLSLLAMGSVLAFA